VTAEDPPGSTTPAADGAGATAERPEADAIPFLEPRDGVPPVVVDAQGLADAADRLAAGSGPVALDAERASGYRYGQRAYLVQLRRTGAGTVLVDPTAVTDLDPLAAALTDTEWVLHAASQDLTCLAEIGLRPTLLFDTELAGRLLGHPRVGLAALTESVLGHRLEKGHAAVDWSTRPLPEAWLRYAALDVEVLVELRDALAAELAEQGKAGWAAEEFRHLVAAAPSPPRTDPWRRTSGLHRVRSRRGLAAVRELWLVRDQMARDRDVAPGRILPDSALVAAAQALPTDRDALTALPVFGGRATRRLADRWMGAIDRARELADSELPPQALPTDGPPPARSWADKDPEAAARLAVLRPTVSALADQLRLPTENLLTPDTLRRIAWQPPDHPSADAVAAALRDRGAREWQITLTAAPIAEGLARCAEGPPAR
jgi:ribonuclease D